MYTGSFQFAQLEQSPHVRTAGRAFYHGSWGRPDPPKDTSAGDSDSSSASSEGSGGTAGGGPELEGGSSGEDREEEMEGANFGLDGTVGRDDEEGVTAAGQKKKESKRRLAWGWPKRKEGEGEKRKRKRGNSYRGGDYVDDPGKMKSPAGGFGDSSDDDADGTGRQGYLQERNNKDRDQRKVKEKKRRERKKNKKPRAQEKSKPHGEGYVEFLDGWGVSQVGAYRKLNCLLG